MSWRDWFTPTKLLGILLAILGLALLVFIPVSHQWLVLVQAVYLWVIALCVAVGSSLALGFPLRRNARGVLIVLGFSMAWIFLFFLPLPNEFRLWPPTILAFVVVLVYRHYYYKRNPNAML